MESQPRHLRADVRLAPVGPEHADAMSRWLADPGISGALGVHRETSLEETERWIARAAGDASYAPFAIYAEDRHVGNVVLDQLDPHVGTARLSIYIGEEDARGAGIGEAAVELALGHAFAELGLYKVWLTVHAGNEAAIATYERRGFTTEGVLRGEFMLDGERVDALRMAIEADRFERR